MGRPTTGKKNHRPTLSGLLVRVSTPNIGTQLMAHRRISRASEAGQESQSQAASICSSDFTTKLKAFKDAAKR